ncbi:MAG: SDR family oxidoreductase [Bacteroidota bacterium]
MSSTNKIALVTGSSRGLGKNMALRLADQGLDVVVTYHANAAAAAEVESAVTAKGQRALSLQLDTSDIAGLDNFIIRLQEGLQDTFGRSTIDFLVNNAGTGYHAAISDTEEAQFDQLVNIHFKGVYFLTQKILGLLADGGGIVNVSTGLARFAIPGYSAYASMKGAVQTFTTYLAKELGGRGIRANSVAPGAIDTDFNAAAFEHNPGMKDFLSGVTALGRVGQAEDIGGVVAFLCTSAAKWITAQRIEVSGGMFI